MRDQEKEFTRAVQLYLYIDTVNQIIHYWRYPFNFTTNIHLTF